MARTTDPEVPGFGTGGASESWSKMQDEVLAMVDSTLHEYRADADRVYLTGLSFGGAGTWHLAMAVPEHWAAIAPICGPGDPALTPSLVQANVPVWVFQGGPATRLSVRSGSWRPSRRWKRRVTRTFASQCMKTSVITCGRACMKAGISTTGSWRTADESAPPASAPGASAWMSSLDRIALQTFGQRFPTTHPAETTPGFVRTTNTFRLPLTWSRRVQLPATWTVTRPAGTAITDWTHP